MPQGERRIPEDLQGEFMELMERAYILMPLGTKKRSQWVSDVIDLYEKIDREEAI